MAISYLDIPNSGSSSWKEPVANVGSLPALNNNIGDARVTKNTQGIYIWDGAAWQPVTGGGGGGDISNGGNSFGEAISIGTGDAFPLDLQTDGTVRFEISASDNTLSTPDSDGNSTFNLKAGNATTGNNDGAPLNITAGDGFDDSQGGNIVLQAGAAPGAGNGGVVNISGGTSAGSQGGGIQLSAGASSTTNGGEILIQAGDGVTNGGSITLNSGTSVGTDGHLALQVASSEILTVSIDNVKLHNHLPLRLADTLDANYIGLRAPSSVSSSYDVTLPSIAPGSNSFLKYDGTNYVWDTTIIGEHGNTQSSSTITINFSTSPAQRLALNGDCALTLINGKSGGAYVLNIVQDSTPRALTFTTTVNWAAAGAPDISTLTSGQWILINLYYDSQNKYSGSYISGYGP